MKHILQVLRFEYVGAVKSKSFIISTVIFMALIVLMTFLPGLIMSVRNAEQEPSEVTEKPVVAVVDHAYGGDKMVQTTFQSAFQSYQVRLSKEAQQELVGKVNSSEYQFAIVIDDKLSFTYVTKNNSLMSNDTQMISAVLRNIYQVKGLEELGVSPEKSNALLNAEVKVNTLTTGVDQTKNYWSTYILMMLLYMAIIMYGQMVSQSVVSEKNSRAMEMLITCARPSHLMFGKVIGSGLAGLTQLVLILSTALFSMKTVSADSLPEGLMDFLSFPVSTVLYAILFFILGYFIYSFLLAALSSLASRSEDLNTLISPVMILVVAAFMIVILSISSGSADSPLMVVCSYIPFTAPLAMFARIVMTDVALWELLLSVGVQLVSVYLLGMLASAIYRIGVLMYGKAPKPTEIIRLLRAQRTARTKQPKQ